MFANTEPLTPLRFLERSAEVFPDRPAIVHGSRVWTYEQFERDVRRFATALLPLLPGSDGSAGTAASSMTAGSDDAAGSPETVRPGDAAGSARSAVASADESFQGAALLERSWPTVAVIAPPDGRGAAIRLLLPAAAVAEDADA